MANLSDVIAGGGNPTLAITQLTGLTTKGDLLVTPTGGIPAMLQVGTDTHVLTADAASTNGVKWAAGGSGGPSTGSTLYLYNNYGGF